MNEKQNKTAEQVRHERIQRQTNDEWLAAYGRVPGEEGYFVGSYLERLRLRHAHAVADQLHAVRRYERTEGWSRYRYALAAWWAGCRRRHLASAIHSIMARRAA